MGDVVTIRPTDSSSQGLILAPNLGRADLGALANCSTYRIEQMTSGRADERASCRANEVN